MPERGVPDNPEAWLLTVARRKMIDAHRERRLDEGVAEHLALLAELAEKDPDGAQIPDDRLRSAFTALMHGERGRYGNT